MYNNIWFLLNIKGGKKKTQPGLSNIDDNISLKNDDSMCTHGLYLYTWYILKLSSFFFSFSIKAIYRIRIHASKIYNIPMIKIRKKKVVKWKINIDQNYHKT